MPLLPGKSQATVSSNIREFHGGGTFAKTEANHGKETADKQAVAVAMHEKDKSGGMDHKAAIGKMNHEHVHRLVQDAHAGKFGPEAQKTAQQAMQPAAPTQGSGEMGAEGEQPATPARNYASMFSGQGEPDGDEMQQAPQSKASMFTGR